MKAFPWQERLNSDDPNVLNPVPHGGMDLRDYFAAKVLEGYISAKAWHPEFYMDFNLPYAEKGYAKDILPKVCYQYADAMMKAREK